MASSSSIWQVSQGTFSLPATNMFPGDTSVSIIQAGLDSNIVLLEITNIEEGAYVLNASNFKIGNGSLLSSSATNTTYNTTEYRWGPDTTTNNWNADEQIELVKFYNTEEEVSAGNKVIVEIELAGGHPYSGDTNVYIDIDTINTPTSVNEDHGTGGNNMVVSATVQFNESSLHAVTENHDSSNGVDFPAASVNTADGISYYSRSGTWTSMGNSSNGVKVMELEFKVNSNGTDWTNYPAYYDTSPGMGPTVTTNYDPSFVTPPFAGAYLHSTNIISMFPEYTTHPVTGAEVLWKFKVQIFYNPLNHPEWPSSVLQNLDEFYALGHTFTVNYNIVTPDPLPEGIIQTTTSHTVELDSIGGTTKIDVTGAKDSEYALEVQRATSETNNNPDRWWNFDTDTFSSTPVPAKLFTLDSSKKASHFISIPSSTDTKIYNVITAPRGTTTLNSRVPSKAGDLQITQKGIKTATIKPGGDYYDSSNYGTLPTKEIKRQERFKGMNSQGYANLQHEIARGGTDGVSSTKIVLDKENDSIKSGMYVFTPFKGNGVPHLTKVIRVDRRVITVSNACTLPANSNIRFQSNSPCVEPFSLTITPGSGKTIKAKPLDKISLDLADNTRISSMRDFMICGRDSIIRTNYGATSDSSSCIMREYKTGIVTGMRVYGAGIVGSQGEPYAKVSTTYLPLATLITITPNQSLVDGQILTFKDDPGVTDTLNPDVKPLHLQMTDQDGNVKLEGYVEVKDIKNTADIEIFLKGLIDVV